MASRTKFRIGDNRFTPTSHVIYYGAYSAGISHAARCLAQGLLDRELCILLGPGHFVDAVLRRVVDAHKVVCLRPDKQKMIALEVLGSVIDLLPSSRSDRARLVGCPNWLPEDEMLAWESLLTSIVETYKFPSLCVHDESVVPKSVIDTHPEMLHADEIVPNPRFVAPRVFRNRLRTKHTSRGRGRK